MEDFPAAMSVVHMAAPTVLQTTLFWICRIFGLVWTAFSFSLLFQLMDIPFSAKKEIRIFLRFPFPFFVILSIIGSSFLTLFVAMYGHFGVAGILLYSFFFFSLFFWGWRVRRHRQLSPRFALVCEKRKDWLLALACSLLVSVLAFHFLTYSVFRLPVDVLSIS